MPSPLLPFLFLLLPLLSPSSALSTFRFNLLHRFSHPVKRWAAERAGVGFRHDDWPQQGTLDYYAALADHDRAIHGRHLASLGSSNETLIFYQGNATVKLSALGFLHYAEVTLGTPNMTFLVALDTGSDLFWVPCDCKQCAPLASASYEYDFEFNVYSPNRSSTSKKVPCSNNLCEAQESHECPEAGSNCPYKVAYLSSDTSSSGVLVEDVIYLTGEDDDKVVDAPIVFGCGQFQTGSFLEAAAPNGLLGLGMEKISVPSILANGGLIADSFSMCFGTDGIGRIILGDQGSPDQDETPFNLKQSHPTYNVSVTGLLVGKDLIDANFSTILDTGTSFTYLADPAYTSLSKSFNSQSQDKLLSSDSRIPFEYCYYISPNSEIPNIILTMKDGGLFSVLNPIIVISDQATKIYCLAVIKTVSLNIIGQNFMTGNRIVFDREKSILGWKKFNCYDTEDSKTGPVRPRNSTSRSAAPPIAFGPNSYNPETTQTGNAHQNPVLPIPPLINQSPGLRSCFRETTFVLPLFILAIILL